MKRNSFIKSLLGLIAVPSLISKIDWGKKDTPLHVWNIMIPEPENIVYTWRNGELITHHCSLLS